MSVFANVEQLPPDTIFDLKRKHDSDPDPSKINLGIGAYRDNDGKPWVLRTVAKVRATKFDGYNHEYLPITGLPALHAGAQRVLFGENAKVVQEGKVATTQSISGTGSLTLAAVLLRNILPDVKSVLIPDPTWGNHRAIFTQNGFDVTTYKYFNPADCGLDFDGMCESLRAAPPGSVVVLHACAHNPTGVDPTPEQWLVLSGIIKEHKLFPLIDNAYQGFATGDVERDAAAVRMFADAGMEMFVCQSFAKNFGLYGERTGCFHVVTNDAGRVPPLLSQISAIARAMYSNPPKFGAHIVATILNDETLYKEWCEDLQTMAGRILSMRQRLRDSLVANGTPGNWDHITKQIGMFSFTGLTKAQVQCLIEKHHVYLLSNGRISLAGLNDGNIDKMAAAVKDAVESHP